VSRLRLRLDDDDDDDDDNDNVGKRVVCLYPMVTALMNSSFVVAIKKNVQYLDTFDTPPWFHVPYSVLYSISSADTA
jgi:hypothetical protein